MERLEVSGPARPHRRAGEERPAGPRQAPDQQGHRDAPAGALAVPRRHPGDRAQGVPVRERHRQQRAARYDIPVAVGILASNREIYSIGIGCDVDDIKEKWDRAEQHQIEPVLVDNPPCQEIVIQGAALDQPGNGVDALPIPISTPGFDNAPYASCSMFISKDPDTGAPEHRQLPRDGEKPDPDGHESRRSSSTRASTSTG